MLDKAKGALLVILALATALLIVLAFWFNSALASKKEKIAELNGYVLGYQKAQKTELEIRVKQDDLNVKVQNAKAQIVQLDPKCADPQPTVDAFVDGVNGLRGKAKDDHSAEP